MGTNPVKLNRADKGAVLLTLPPRLLTYDLSADIGQLANGGIALVFWDNYITDWYDANAIFYPAYTWKTTFAVYGWSGYSVAGKNMMLELQNSYGHRIENHGNSSLTFSFYGNDVDAFFDAEVEPSRIAMEADGVNPIRIFAFADGQRNTSICKKVVDDSPHEMTLTTYFGQHTDVSYSYSFDSNLWVVGDTTDGLSSKAWLGMDTSHESFSLTYILSLLEYCKDNNKILILGGHRILEDDSGIRVTSYDTLHAICQYIINNGMKFYTLENLIDRFSVSNMPTKPYVRRISYTGDAAVWEIGTKMRVSFVYMDDQDRPMQGVGNIPQWYRADDENGTNEIAIPGGGVTFYTLVEADRNKYLRASIIPYNSEDTGYESFPGKRHLVS